MSVIAKRLATPVCGAFKALQLSTAARALSTQPQYLKEFSVVYTDRAVNLMSAPFGDSMRTMNDTLKRAYTCDSVTAIPGSGSYGMEAVARAFALNKKALVLRNGWFSYRWTEIFEACNLGTEATVLTAQPLGTEVNTQYTPHPIEDVVSTIRREKPAVVMAPHTETSTGIILSDSYIKAVADAAHEVGAKFVLDGIASGTIWVDMKELGVDVYITAPQKGWSGPACVGLVMMGEEATKHVRENPGGNSYAVNLLKWLEVMDAYVAGGFKYYTTLPTDSIMAATAAMVETEKFGYAESRKALEELGGKIRSMLAERGYKSVAAKGCESPGVVVVYSDDANAVAKFKAEGIQVAAGVPWEIGEPKGLNTFRIGLFGLDKIADVDGTVNTLARAVDAIKS